MFSNAVIVCALLALASARQYTMINYLKKDIIVSVTGFDDIPIGVNQTETLVLPDLLVTNLTAVYADCQDKACYEAQTTFTVKTGKDDYNWPEDRYEIVGSRGFNLPIWAVPGSSMFCQKLTCQGSSLIEKCSAKDSVMLNGEIVGCKADPSGTFDCDVAYSSCRWYLNYKIYFQFTK